jgi:hypothetical protein
MYAPDKVKIVVLLPVEVAMKIEKRAKEKGTKVAKYAATMLYHDTSDDPWTQEDEARRKEIIDENFRRREAALAKRRAARAAKAANANRRAK